MNEERVARIVNAVLAELAGRGGFDILHVISSDDPDVWQDLHAGCVQSVHAVKLDRPDPNASLIPGA